MAKTQTFDVTRNISGLAGIKNINETQVDEEPVRKKEVIEERRPEKKEPVSEKRASLNEILAPVKKKETKTMHKNFLMTEYHYNEFKKLAKERGQSENALFNDILVQMFGEKS